MPKVKPGKETVKFLARLTGPPSTLPDCHRTSVRTVRLVLPVRPVRPSLPSEALLAKAGPTQSRLVKPSQTKSNHPSPLLIRDPYPLPKSLAGNSQS
jgi:hypothetical protein